MLEHNHVPRNPWCPGSNSFINIPRTPSQGFRNLWKLIFLVALVFCIRYKCFRTLRHLATDLQATEMHLRSFALELPLTSTSSHFLPQILTSFKLIIFMIKPIISTSQLSQFRYTISSLLLGFGTKQRVLHAKLTYTYMGLHGNYRVFLAPLAVLL